MWSIRTASRLHLGLLTLPSADASATERRFGGVGMMIDSPGIAIRAEPSSKWLAEGLHQERVSEIVARVLAGLGTQEKPVQIPCRKLPQRDSRGPAERRSPRMRSTSGASSCE